MSTTDSDIPAHERMFYCDDPKCTRHELGRGCTHSPKAGRARSLASLLSRAQQLTTDFRPIVIPASRVLAAGITPALRGLGHREAQGREARTGRQVAGGVRHTHPEQVHKIGACNGDRSSKS
jgi:hypothetical protein